MRHERKIQQPFAVLLLLVFAISIVPKSYIHYAVANHQDYENACKHATHQGTCVKAAGINCHFNDLVVNIPYLYQHNDVIPGVLLHFAPRSVAYIPVTILTAVLNKESRGPPSLA